MIMLYQLHLLVEKGKINFLINIIQLIINRVIELAQKVELEHKPTLEELLSAIVNRIEVEELFKQTVKFI